MSDELQPHVLAQFKVIKKIGSGAYGHVFKVTDKKTKKTKALKKNFDAFNNSTDAQRTYREIMFLFELNHPNIVILEEVIKAENGKDIYLVFEHMDVDLYTLIRENILQEKHKKYILYQTAKSILYLHSSGLIHRDLKPSNILVNESCDAKLCDFGLVRSIDDKHTDNFDILTEYIATRWYRAPQILLGSRIYSKGIDIWSFGCLVAEMLKGKPLFPGNSTLNQIQKVLMWTGAPSNEVIASLKTQCGKEVFELFSNVKRLNHNQMVPNADSNCLDLIGKTLQFNPDKRLTIQQIMKHPYLKDFFDPADLAICQKKMKLPIDDNRRLSLKDYRSLLYEEIKKRSHGYPMGEVGLKDITFYRIREKPKKTIRTEESEKNRESAHKKMLKNFQNNSRTVSIKRTDNSSKKAGVKGQSLHPKNLKTIIHQQSDTLETKKMALFKEHNRATKQQWNRGKRSVTQGDARTKSKMFAQPNLS